MPSLKWGQRGGHQRFFFESVDMGETKKSETETLAFINALLCFMCQEDTLSCFGHAMSKYMLSTLLEGSVYSRFSPLNFSYHRAEALLVESVICVAFVI